MTRRFLWNGQLRLVAELDGSGNLVSQFVYGTKVNVPDYMLKGGVTYRLITEQLGSVRLGVNARRRNVSADRTAREESWTSRS